MKQYKHIIDFCYAYMSLSDEDKKKFMKTHFNLDKNGNGQFIDQNCIVTIS